ncbi:MAG: hypothetical protein ACI8V8_000381 [Chitinophagales bacterium]|jgi:hypothetical protein
MKSYIPPYLSIVVAVRNDNYGGDFNKRLYAALKWNTQLLETYKISSEFVLVNWNPISTNPPLLTEFEFPKNRDFVRYKIIDVPPEFHQKYENEKVRKSFPMYEFIAKNVGIKRSKGDFILCTNADILFSEEIIKEIANQSLKKGTLYRSVRIDYDSPNKFIQNEREIKQEVSGFFLRTGVIKSSIRLGFPIKKHWCRFKDFIRTIVFANWSRLLSNLDYRKERAFIYKFPFNASGDFALMDQFTFTTKARYPEDTLISTHADSLHLLQCLNAQLEVEEFKGIVYHQEHLRRFNFNTKNEEMDLMFIRLLKSIRAYLNGNLKSSEVKNLLDDLELKQETF